MKFNCPDSCCKPVETEIDPLYGYVYNTSRPAWKKETQLIRNDLEDLRDELSGDLRKQFEAIKDRLSLLVQKFNEESILKEMNQ